MGLIDLLQNQFMEGTGGEAPRRRRRRAEKGKVGGEAKREAIGKSTDTKSIDGDDAEEIGSSKGGAPWDEEGVKKISKKLVIEWLQDNATERFLKDRGLDGKVGNLLTRKTKRELDEAYLKWVSLSCGRGATKKLTKTKNTQKDETSTKKEPTSPKTVAGMRPLKSFVLAVITKRLKRFHPVLLRKMPDVR
jgi:hypothetical protein